MWGVYYLMGKNGNRWWEEKKTLCPATGGATGGGKRSTYLRHRVLRGVVGTQVKGCSMGGSALSPAGWWLLWTPAYVLSGLQLLWTTPNAGVRGAEAASPQLPTLPGLRCEVSDLWAPGLGSTRFTHRGLGGSHLLLQPETPEVSSHCLGRAALPGFDST